MTWSIVARDPVTGAFGVAVATRFFAVGALCAHADGGIGGLATQALINPTFGARGLRLLREGVPAQVVIDLLLAADPGRESRQVHLQDASGAIATHTGSDCIPWCGEVVHEVVLHEHGHEGEGADHVADERQHGVMRHIPNFAEEAQRGEILSRKAFRGKPLHPRGEIHDEQGA